MKLYFFRLGGKAKVLYPVSLRKSIENMYYEGIHVYKTQKKELDA